MQKPAARYDHIGRCCIAFPLSLFGFPLFAAPSASTVNLEAPLSPISIQCSENIDFEISPAIELLAGVQSQTTWCEMRGGGSGGGNAYARELSAFFEPYKGSSAVLLSQNFTDSGFSYDAPPAFALSLGPLFEAPGKGFDDYLVDRAGGAKRLEAFRASLVSLSKKSDFASFFSKHEAEYRRWLSAMAEGFDGESISAWLKSFFGYKHSPVFHFILAPAMFPGGGYGFSREMLDQGQSRLHVYQIVRVNPSESAEPDFPSGRSLALLALHEFGHSFLNPSIGDRGDRMKDSRLRALFAPVKAVMKDMAYPKHPLFLNELILRAVVLRAGVELGYLSAMDLQAGFFKEANAGFYCIEEVYALILEYEAQRDRYPNFEEYAPALLGALAESSKGLAAAFEKHEASLKPVAAFHEDFEGETGAAGLPEGWRKYIGAQLDGKGGPNVVSVDGTKALEGNHSLFLRVNESDSAWYSVSRAVAVKRGKLTLRCLAAGTELEKKAWQFENCYVGFILTKRNGGKEFYVEQWDASFERRAVELEVEVDPARVASIECVAFLSIDGELRVDEIEVRYRKD